MSRHFCRVIPRIHGWVAVVALVLTLLGGYLTTKLSLESDLAALLPGSFPSVQALEAMEAEVGGAVSTVRVVLVSEDFQAMLRLAADLKPEFEASEYVLYAQYQNEVDFYRENALLFLDEEELDSLYHAVDRAIEEEKQAANPFMVDDLFGPPPSESAESEAVDDLAAWEGRYQDAEPRPYLTDADSSVLVVEVAAAAESANLSFSQEMVSAIEEIVDALDPESYAADMEVLLGGNVKNRIDEFEALRNDIFGTAVYGITGVLLLLVLYFRSLAAPLLIALALAASQAWTFGVTYLLIGQLNTITGFLFVVLFGLGIDYGVHAFARYREAREAGLDQEQGLHKMVCDTGRALATTTFTTSAAFFSLLLMDFRGFSELGLITGIGLIFALIAMVVLLPSLIIMAERIGLLEIREVPGKSLSFEPRPLGWTRPVLVVGLVVTLLAIFGFTRVGFQYDFTDLRFISAERERVGELTDGVFSRSQSPALVLADSPEEAAAIERYVEELIRTDTISPTVDQVSSIFSLIPLDQEPRLERIRAIRELIDRENARDLLSGDDRDRLDRLESYLAVDEPVRMEDIPEDELRPFLDRTGQVGSFVFIYPSVALRDGRNSIAFAEDIGTIALPSGEVFHAASSNLIIADLIRMVIREGEIAVALSLLVVFLIVWADTRSFRESVLVISPLLFGIVWMGGLMFLLGMKFNLFNMVVLPSIVGIGVDSGVHIRHRFREEGAGSLHLVLRRTGPAVAMATLTTIVGYTGLIMASHPGLQSIGYLAVVGLLATLLAALVLLPSLLQWADRRFGTQG